MTTRWMHGIRQVEGAEMDTKPLVDLERWGTPGELWVQTIRSTNPDLPGWMVYDSRGWCRLRRSTEDEVRAWMAEKGYQRQTTPARHN